MTISFLGYLIPQVLKGRVQCCFMHSELFTLLKSWFQKTILTYNRVFLCQKSHFRVRTSFGKFFSIVALADVNDCGTPYMGISPRRTQPLVMRGSSHNPRVGLGRVKKLSLYLRGGSLKTK